MKKIVKRILLSVAAIFLAIVLVVGGYVAYVMISYKRIEDNLALSVGGAEIYAKVSVGEEYTIVTQNVGFGAYTADFTFFMDGGKESRAKSEESVINCINAAADKISSFSPDFALIQEVDIYATRSFHIDEKKLLDERFSGFSSTGAINYDSAYLMWPLFKPHGASKSSLVTYSAYGVSSAIRRSLPISTGLSKFLDLDRCYATARIPTADGKELVIYNTHFSAYGSDDSIRTAQMTMLFEDMKTEYDKGNYCVCGGDYNHDFTGNSTKVLNGGESVDFGWAQPFPAELLENYAGITRAMQYSAGEQRPTCRNCDVPYKEGNFTIIVDGFLVSENVTVTYLENVQTGFEYSDHNPVVMKFTLQ